VVVHGVIAQYKLIFAVIQRGSSAHHNIDDAISDVAVYFSRLARPLAKFA